MTTETQNKRIPFSEKKEQLMRNPKFVEAYELIKNEYEEESRKIPYCTIGTGSSEKIYLS